MSEMPPTMPPAEPTPIAPPPVPEPPRFSIGMFLLGVVAGLMGGGAVCGGIFFGAMGLIDALHVRNTKPFALLAVIVPTAFIVFALVRSTRKHTSSFTRGLLLGAAVQFLLWSACAVLLTTLRIGG